MKKMRRTQILLTEKQHDFLHDKSEKSGMSISELIRREIDFWAERENTKNK